MRHALEYTLMVLALILMVLSVVTVGTFALLALDELAHKKWPHLYRG